MNEREARIAYNETLFRQLNERLSGVLEEIGDSADRLEIICECGVGDCITKITVGKAEYEQVRQHSAQFLVAVGHVSPDVERVVRAADGYDVVEKHPEEAAIARATDPRA
jgi:hypothetical protein